MTVLTAFCLWLSLAISVSGNSQLFDDAKLRDDLACNNDTQPLVLTDPTGTFTSPNYPSDYPVAVDCSWLILAQDESSTVHLDFTELTLERGFDFVYLNDGNTTEDLLITRFDGAWTPPPTGFKSSGPSLLVRFHSDPLAPQRGFSATFTSTFLDLTPDPCFVATRPAIFTDFNGTIQSNYFPDYYLNYAECQWVIEAQHPQGVVRVDFSAFSTETNYDFVNVLDGNTTNSPLISRLSGNRTGGLPGPYLSTQRYLTVDLTSDLTVTSTGFQAAFTTVLPAKCGTILHEAPDDALVGNGFDEICYLDIEDTQFIDMQCTDLLQNIAGIGNAQDLVDQGGNFGCLLSARDDFVGSQAACYDNYQWQTRLSNCAGCNKLIACVRYGSP